MAEVETPTAPHEPVEPLPAEPEPESEPEPEPHDPHPGVPENDPPDDGNADQG